MGRCRSEDASIENTGEQQKQAGARDDHDFFILSRSAKIFLVVHGRERQ